MDIAEELKQVIKEYEQRFNREIPSWRCSEEERLNDLKEALETGVPFPEDDEETVY